MKSTKTFLVICFMLANTILLAQKREKIYFDEDWDETIEEYASYYRLIEKVDDLYQASDYFLNGQVQMKGTFEDKKCTIYVGHFVWYDSAQVITTVKNYANNQYDGEVIEYYPNGQIKIFNTYSLGNRHGVYKEQYPDGSLRAVANFKEGKLVNPAYRYYQNGKPQLTMEIDENGNGVVTTYYPNETLKSVGSLKNGFRIGKWISYDSTGVVTETIEKNDEANTRKTNFNLTKLKATDPIPYKYQQLSDVFFSNYYFDYNPIDGVIEFPDVEASYVGGIDAMRSYIQNSLVYPEQAIKRNKQGRVYVSFVVETDGSISNIQIERGPYLLRAETIRLIQNMPKWNPGEYKGKKVRVRCRLPINYTLT